MIHEETSCILAENYRWKYGGNFSKSFEEILEKLRKNLKYVWEILNQLLKFLSNFEKILKKLLVPKEFYKSLKNVEPIILNLQGNVKLLEQIYEILDEFE